MSRMNTFLLVSGLAISACGIAAEGENPPLKNWFNDPFFQIRDAIRACPVPLGPLITEAQRREEAHYRVERGTSCWMAGKCEKPNSYLYDAPIAMAIRQRFAQGSEFDDASLWITVQRRFVIVQGCIARPEQAPQIDAIMRAIPDVERVVLQLVTSANQSPPYPLAPKHASAADNSALP
jgi:hypothetical protein